MTNSSRASAFRRTGLLASTALFMLSGTSAFAQDRLTILDAMDTPHGSTADISRVGEALDSLTDGGLAPHTYVGDGHVAPIEGGETPSITINNGFNTTTDVYDPTNVTGVGQIVRDAGGGSVGLCTGTLINPRTVIFAAHCVNTNAATAYGANSGGIGVAVGFETNTRANAAGQTDELVRWLLGQGANQDGRFQTNRAQQLYNLSQVFWNPASRAAASCTAPTSCFLEADIATGVLDTPTRGVPTWTMLFSPLTGPATIDPANGTGIHVAIGGYGSFGNGTTGSATSGNFRRRLAENILGGLTSINERNLFIFGTAGAPSRPQLLYWLDFDDPARGTATANPRDFNGFRDNALPREGLTGPGDSGSALIVDRLFGQDVRTIIGVLSGGSTFFNGQPGGSYGTQSFYQPLFLYWDWIVANNPYRYVTAVAGNRNWEDGAAWVTTLDPSYQVLLNGALVNGLPTNTGGTNVNTDGQFGELCFQSPSTSTNPVGNECFNLATRQPRDNVPNNPASGLESAPAVASIGGDTNGGTVTAGLSDDGLPTGAIETPHAAPGYTDTLAPAPTILNGLPGATNFVPNNFAGDRVNGVIARYYDVTLRNAGNITLNSAVTIDNFAVAGAQSQLTVANGASLTSLLDINQVTGIVNVNGTVRALGDYFFMSGLLTGNGRVNANFLTSVMGNFAPGTVGTVGTLTVGGNLVMASGSTYALDVAGNGNSDRIAVVADGANTGTASVGGRVLISSVPGSIIRFNDLYTILTAAGGVSGTFTTTDISAVLRQTFIYNPNSVQLRITAVPYLGVVSNASATQRAFATLLDQNRGNANLLAIYDVLDLQNQATVQSTLENLAPRTETLRQALASVAIDHNGRLYRERISSLQPGDLGGQVAYLGRRVETAALNVAGLSNGTATMSDVAVQPAEVSTRLPETMSAFVSVGYLDGRSAPMPGGLPVVGDDEFDGFYGAVGVEKEIGRNTALGFSLSYTNVDGQTVAGAQEVEGDLYLATLYGKTRINGGPIEIDGQASVGVYQLDTERAGNLPGTPFTLRSSSNSLAAAGELGIGAMFGQQIRFGPRISGRVSMVDFDDVTELGGPTALVINRDTFDSFQGRAGLVVDGVGRIRPTASAYYVREFNDGNSTFGANFVGGIGPNAVFNLVGRDKEWFEVSGGLTMDFGRISLSLSADSTLDRDDVENQSYRGTVRFRF